MAVVQLATSADVKAALGRDLTPSETARVGAILDKASELFRRRSGQMFTAGSSVVRLKVNGGRVCLPQRPVVSVASVTDDRGDAVEYDLSGQWLTVPLLSHEFVTVDYSHGGTVPDVVRLAVADLARRVLLVHQDASTGVSQRSETTGPFTESQTFAAWAVGGQTMLSPDDVALADSFRAKIPTVWVQRA